ncbi:MAG: hypothetical protein KY455_06305 [Euryarchaeota archaeon]|nr:hypothetical protein [Euryarchaeota archaeon]
MILLLLVAFAMPMAGCFVEDEDDGDGTTVVEEDDDDGGDTFIDNDDGNGGGDTDVFVDNEDGGSDSGSDSTN